MARQVISSLLLFILLTPTSLPAHPPITTLLYYLEEPSSLASAVAHLDQISIIAPQVFVMDKEGFVLNIHVSYRHLYNLFVEEAARRFRHRGLKFSVAVVAKHSDQPEAYVESFWRHWAGVFDYATLGRVTDFLSIMTYDQHTHGTPPGPMAGLPWVKRVIEYTLTQVPSRKISLGIPLYFRSWNSAGLRGGYGGFREAQALLNRSGLEAGWDDTEQVPWFRYRADGITHEVWYEDVQSFQAKLALVEKHGLQGFSAWVIGQEDSRIWEVLSQKVQVRRPLTTTGNR